MKKLSARVKEAVHRYSLFGKIAEIAQRRRHRFHKEVEANKAKVETAERDLEHAVKEGNEHSVSRRTIEDFEQVLAIAEHHLKRSRRKLDFWRQRYVWANERHQHWGLVLKHRRDRLRAWIARHRTFQPYMANGRPWIKLTPEARHGIFLDFKQGLYVTSTYEGYPGDGVHATSSGHYVQNQPDGRARCWDAASTSVEKMVAAQHREARRAGAFMVELLGPDNAFEYKNGLRYTLPEGDPLEEMHDNHKHTWIRDGAPT